MIVSQKGLFEMPVMTKNKAYFDDIFSYKLSLGKYSK